MRGPDALTHAEFDRAILLRTGLKGAERGAGGAEMASYKEIPVR